MLDREPYPDLPDLPTFAEQLTAAGHTVHVPDLYDSRTFDELEEGLAYAKSIGFDTILDRGITAWRDRLLLAEQQREDAQRAAYHGHRSVSELAGQLQSQQGRLDSARDRIAQVAPAFC